MKRTSRGLLSELVLVRMHGRTAAYLEASDVERAQIVATCRTEATVRDLPERILSRTIYSQSSTRSAPLRELLQNALDASPRGARIDVRSSREGREVFVSDNGRGMTTTELLEDLLVPFRSGKELASDVIGEHGIGFLCALEVAPSVDVTTRTRLGGSRLSIRPVGQGPAYRDFTWELSPFLTSDVSTGTTVRLELERATDPLALAADVAAVAGLVDPGVARVFVDGALVNTARAKLRRVALVPVGAMAELGHLELFVGAGEGVFQEFALTQKGIRIAARHDPFTSPDLALHRDLLRALWLGGYGLVAELPTGVPLNKGRSSVAAIASRPVDEAIISAFERFVLEDALHDRELLRAVDHRLASILDRMVASAIAGEAFAVPSQESPSDTDRTPLAAAGAPPDKPLAPTVAAPEEVVRFASALVEAPLFAATALSTGGLATRHSLNLRAILAAHRAGVLRSSEEPLRMGQVHLTLSDPLSNSLWRRLSTRVDVPAPPRRVGRVLTMQKVARDQVVHAQAAHSGLPALAAVLMILERIDAAISAAANLPPSPISVHQDLYGPDEMAHTDGTGISVNLASPRVRALLAAVLEYAEPIAFGALVDLFAHEKAHVSLATFVPRANAEHGTSFYRRKDWLRRRILEAIASGAVLDPAHWVAMARHGLSSLALPSPEELASTFQAPAP